MMKKFLILLCSVLMSAQAFAQIKPNQSLHITIQGVSKNEQERLNSKYQVSASGHIKMWQIGQIKAAGKSKIELGDMISKAYKNRGIYKNPVFQVTTKSDEILVRQTYTVGGQVKAPGSQDYRDGVTLFEAVQAAGGATTFGALNRVKLFRAGKVQAYNLKDDKIKTIKIYPGDAIEIPQKTWSGN